MPELPEVETTRLGIAPHLKNNSFQKVIIRQRQLRWPVPANLSKVLQNKTITEVTRRAKYLLLSIEEVGTLIIHLGMSGSLRFVTKSKRAEKHDHIDFVLQDKVLRYNDPRRFGAVLLTDNSIENHELIMHLGPEPLTRAYSAEYMFATAKTRKAAVKSFIMDNKVVVGIGNIYATEALFAAGIHPERSANKVTLQEFDKLVNASKEILQKAIEQGGTTLKDFTDSNGKPGYFKQSLKVYGRVGDPCFDCGAPIKKLTLGQRTSSFCPSCQL